MKKTILSLLTIIMIIGMLGCSSDSNNEGEADVKSDSSVTVEQQNKQETGLEEALKELGKELGVDAAFDSAKEAMEYVDKSRVSADANNYRSLVVALNVAIAETAGSLEMPANYKFTMTDSGVTVTHNGQTVGNEDALVSVMTDLVGVNLNQCKASSKDAKYVLELDGNGNIVETVAP